MRPCILHIDMDAFYASVEQLRHPELRGKPVIVGGDGRRGVVAAASYEARRFGVRSAMPAGEARRLCPNGVFLPPDFATYRAASSQVFAVLGRFTPLIEPLSLDEAFLDMSGNPQARSDPEGLAVQLKAEVHSATGLTASVGVSTCKVVSKVASDLRKPDGLVVVDAGKEEAFLRPLPLRALPGLGPAAEKKLEGLGLRTVGELAALPVEVLAARLGKLGPVLHEMAHGVDGRAVVLPATPKSISREVTFEVDVRDRTELLLTARSLAQDVARSLRRHGLTARTLRLKIRFAGFETHTHQDTVAPTDLDQDLCAGAERLLDEALARERPVRLIGVGASQLQSAAQQELFQGSRLRQHELDRSLDDLRERFGSEIIARGVPVTTLQRDFRRDDIDAVTKDEGG